LEETVHPWRFTAKRNLFVLACYMPDHVTLLSPRARLISAASSLEGASTKDLIAVFAEFARRVPQEPQVMAVLPQLGPLLTVIEDPLLRTLLPSDALADVEAALSELESVKRSMREAVAEIEANAYAEELRRAEHADLLFIDSLVPEPSDRQYLRALRRHMRGVPWSNGRGANGLIEVLSARVGRLLEEGRSLPLLDGEIGDLARRGLLEGVFREGGGIRARAAHAGMAAGLLGRLPSFPLAKMDEVLDIREALRDPLVRFRSEVVEMSVEL
jgi:hypothetical protein